MSMPDDTAYRSRIYTERLEREASAAEWIADKAAEIEAHMATLWRYGLWSAKVSLRDYPDSLEDIVSESLCAVDGNPLYDVLELVREQEILGNPKAIAVMQRITQEHARTVAERIYERRGE